MTRKCHVCGAPFLLDSRWNGLVHVPVPRDPKTGEELAACPGCGEGGRWYEDTLAPEDETVSCEDFRAGIPLE